MSLHASAKQRGIKGATVNSGGGLTAEQINELAQGQRCGNNTVHHKFEGSDLPPFWSGTDADIANDQSLDAGNDRLVIASGSPAHSRFYRGHEGDFDIMMDTDRGGTSSWGLEVILPDESRLLQLKIDSTELNGFLTGESLVTASISTSRLQLRVIKEYDTLTLQYIEGAGPLNPTSTSWITLTTFTGINVLRLGNVFNFAWDDANGGDAYLYEFLMCSNTAPHRINGSGPKSGYLEEDGAGNIVVDPTFGNYFSVTVSENNTLSINDGFIRGQMVTVRVTQGGAPVHTLSFDASINFSTDLPVPTLSAGTDDWDYFTFIWNEENDAWDFVGKVQGFS